MAANSDDASYWLIMAASSHTRYLHVPTWYVATMVTMTLLHQDFPGVRRTHLEDTAG